jgi:hypothetical protein
MRVGIPERPRKRHALTRRHTHTPRRTHDGGRTLCPRTITRAHVKRPRPRCCARQPSRAWLWARIMHGCNGAHTVALRAPNYAHAFTHTHAIISRPHTLRAATRLRAPTRTHTHTRTCAPARSSARLHTTARRRVTHVATPYARKLAPFRAHAEDYRAHVCKRAGKPRAHMFAHPPKHIREAYRVPGCEYVCKGADGVLNRAHTYAIVHHGCARMRVHT